MKVWCVWTEFGEYEQYSRDLRGIFATLELAEAHANQLRARKNERSVEVVEDQVLDALPVSVPYVEYSAHILPDGTEDKGLGYHRGSEFSTWSNELKPFERSEVGTWGADKYINVIGSDEGLVAAEYARLLAEMRAREAPGSVEPS